MSSSIVSPFPFFTDTTGAPLEGGYIFIGQSNLNPETAPVNVFWDSALTIPTAQPVRTVGGYPSRAGTPSRFYSATDTYSITVRNKNRVLVFSAFDQSDAPTSVFDISTQLITATASQTTFSLTTFTYLPGTDTLQVFRNGLRLNINLDYLETNSSTVTLTAPAALGDQFLFQGGAVITGNQTPGTAVSFIQAGAGAITRNMQDKARESVSVLDFGAVGDGVTDDTAAATAAGNANSGVMNFPDGDFLLSSIPSVTGRNVFNLEAGATASGSGASLSGLYTGNIARKQLVESGTSGGDAATQYIRRIADHSGGSPGWVSSALNVRTDVTNSAATNIEWAILGTIQNSAAAGENTGVYGQGIKKSTGPTWGMVAEARDTSNITNPNTGLIGIEVDTFANGSDANNNRVGIDVVIGKNNQSGSLCETAFGIRIGTSNGDITQGRVKYGIQLSAITFDAGFDTSAATQSVGGVAFRMAATQKLSFTATNDRYISYNSGVLQYFNGGATPSLEIYDNAEIQTFGNIRMNNLPTSSVGLPSGSLWRDSAAGNVIKMVP